MNRREHPFFTKKNRPLVLGHRGVPRIHQENTMAGLRAAVELGIDGVEIDVFESADGKLVVFHDEQTERLTGVKGNISELTWDEIARLRVQRTIDSGGGNRMRYPRGQPIALLEEVLDEFKDKLLINIEMKAYGPDWTRRHVGTEVARIIRATGAQRSSAVTSFDFFMLYYLEREYPGLHSGFAYDDDMVAGTIGDWLRRIPEIRTELSAPPGNQNHLSFLNWLAEANAVGRLIGSTLVSVEHHLIDSDTVERFHARQMAVGTYTLLPLNPGAAQSEIEVQEAMARRMAERRVDWVETDDPERLMEIYLREI